MNARREHTTAGMIPCVTTPKEDSIARAKLGSQETAKPVQVRNESSGNECGKKKGMNRLKLINNSWSQLPTNNLYATSHACVCIPNEKQYTTLQ